jgi:hypothetical protein
VNDDSIITPERKIPKNVGLDARMEKPKVRSKTEDRHPVQSTPSSVLRPRRYRRGKKGGGSEF